MSMEWVRKNYGVTAQRGGRIKFFGVEGTITSATHYLRVRMDDGRRVLLHPTWEVEYLPRVSGANQRPGVPSTSEEQT